LGQTTNLCAHITVKQRGVFVNTLFVIGKKFEAGTLSDPHDKPLPEKDDPTPHVLIGDKAFPLKRS